MKKTISPVMLSGMHRCIQLSLTLGATLALGACGTMRSSVLVEPVAGAAYNSPPPRGVPVPAPATAHTPIPGGTYVVMKGDTLYSIAFRNGVDFRDLAQWNGVAEPYTIWPGQRLTLSPSVAGGSTPVAVAATPVTAAQLPSTSVTPVAPVFEPVTTPMASAPVPTSTNPIVSVPVTASAHRPVAPTPTPAPAPVASTAAVAIVPVAGVPAPAPAAVPPPAPPASGISRAVSGISWRWPAQGSLSGRFNASDAIPGIEIAGKAGDAVRAAADGVVVYSGNGLVGYGELVIIKHNDSFLSAYGHNRKRLVKEGQRVSSGQQIAEMGSTGASRNELEFQIRKDGNPVDPLGYLPSR